MRDYTTDQEQIEIIKQWWNDYGKYLLIAIFAGVLLGFGWRSWHGHQITNNLAASELYQQLLVADASMNQEQVNKLGEALTNNYKRSPYAVMANLILAKNSVENNDLVTAKRQLEWIMKYGYTKSFQQIARIRLARVLLAQKKTTEALAILNKMDDADFSPEINSVKGDIYMAMSDEQNAKKSYQLAQQELLQHSMEDTVLKLKLEQSSLQSIH